MRVFLSWSGEWSRGIAAELRRWLPEILPEVSPWMSDIDIHVGDRWSPALANALRDFDVAVIVLTSQNVAAPWVLFEAGALSRTFDRAAVIPYLVDVPVTALSGPLSQFQARFGDRAGTLDVVRRLYELSGSERPISAIDKRFRERWARLERQLQRVRDAPLPPELLFATYAPNASVMVIDGAVEYDLYLARRIDSAKREVCDLTWKETIGLTHDLEGRQRSLRECERSMARAAQRIAYREIFVFNDPRRVEKLQRRLAEQRAGYSCRYFETDDAQIPRIQFILFDDEEVAFGSHGSSVPGVVVRSTELGRSLKAYFEDVWSRAIPIKERKDVYEATVRKILTTMQTTRRLTRRRS